ADRAKGLARRGSLADHGHDGERDDDEEQDHDVDRLPPEQRIGGQRRKSPGAGNPQKPARGGPPGLPPPAPDVRETERGECKVMAAQSQRGEADGETDSGGEQRAEPDAEPRGQPEALGGDRRRVAAEDEESGVAERDLSGIATEQIPARPEQRPDERLRGHGENERMRHEQRQQDRHDGDDGAHGACPTAGIHRVTARPSNPCGRTRSTSTMTANAIRFCHCDGMIMTASASATPTTRLAIKAPMRFPMPPRIVIAKALIVSGKPTAGYTLNCGAMSAPPAPARPTPRAMVSEKIRTRWMPIAWAASGFCATARMARPWR